MLSWEIIAHGRVQGVGFRRHAHSCAKRCGISGYARNLYDGTVLIVASGNREDLLSFCDLLRQGQGFAQVLDLKVTELNSAVEYNDFEIR